MTDSSRKHILYVENGIGYGGAIICLRHLIRNLDSDKYLPMIVTGRSGPQYEDIKKEGYWLHISDRHIDIVGAHEKIDPVRWLDKITGARIVVNQVLARLDDIFNFLPFFFRLFWSAKSFRADLIHANNEPLCNRAALIVGKILKIPTICHVRGDQSGSKAMRWAYGLVDHFIPVSHWVSASIQTKLNIPLGKISVIYDGLELEKLDINADGRIFRKQFDIPENCFAVGLVGLLIPWKGQEIFLDAAKILKEKIQNLKMIIVGGTPDDCISYNAMLRRRVKNEKLENIISFTGHMTDMPVVYNGLDVVVSASTSPEPLGTVVIESMTMGRAVIGPNHGGAAEMMTHNETGLLFEHGNAESLAKEIEKLYSNEKLRDDLGKYARLHALQVFSVQRHAEKVQEVYRQYLRD